MSTIYSQRANSPSSSSCDPLSNISSILNASLGNTEQGSLWNVALEGGKITSTSIHDTDAHPLSDDATSINAHGALLIPSLCHPHVHLDKPYLLSHPLYSHLQLKSGTFSEAMHLTNTAKASFTSQDLLDRGQRLIDESVSSGVTAMRAFVEVDPIVGTKCLDAGLHLKASAVSRCHVQICAFAQLPLFSGHDDGGEEMRRLVQDAAYREGVDVVGSTPYVEHQTDLAKQNIEYMIDLALAKGKHLDFHLDYNLDPDTEPLVWHVISALKGREWLRKSNKTVVLGHCTRLCLFTDEEWKSLKQEIGHLPISFVGLPTSDLYMMRESTSPHRTLPIPRLIKDYGFNACISMNNIGNAFTPQGCCDPVHLAGIGVGVYQAGTVKDAEVLLECISTRAKTAIGLAKEIEGDGAGALTLSAGKEADLVLFGCENPAWRTRRTITEAVHLYDGGSGRRVLKGGLLVEGTHS